MDPSGLPLIKSVVVIPPCEEASPTWLNLGQHAGRGRAAQNPIGPHEPRCRAGLRHPTGECPKWIRLNDMDRRDHVPTVLPLDHPHLGVASGSKPATVVWSLSLNVEEDVVRDLVGVSSKHFGVAEDRVEKRHRKGVGEFLSSLDRHITW